MQTSVGTILVADDEATVRTYVSGVLRREGFQILEAIDGVDALQQVEQRGAPIDLLLTDVRMPGMDGIALARSVTEIYPKTPIIFISGYPFDFENECARHRGRACAFLSKPFLPKALLDAVQKCLEPGKGSRKRLRRSGRRSLTEPESAETFRHPRGENPVKSGRTS